MAWKYKLTNVTYDPGSAQISVEVRIYKDTWTGADKALIKYYQYPTATDATAEKILAAVQIDIAMYQSMKAAASTLATLIDVEQIVP